MKKNYIAVELDLHKSEFGNYILTHYDIMEEIYRSENSQIFKIRQLETNNIQVLKAIQKKTYLNFDLEGFKRVRHENIVIVEQTGESEHFYYMLMEFIEGSTLEKFIETFGPCSTELVNCYIHQIYQALQYLHNHHDGQLIYCDLKPSNLMISNDGKITLIDMNTLRLKKDSSHSDTYYIGSRGFTAPEAYGYAQSTETSDVYSLGATLYFLLTGNTPSVGILFHEEIKSSKLDLKYKAIILKATKFNPKDRYQSVAAVKNAINQHFFIRRFYVVVSLFIILTMVTGFGINKYQALDKEIIDENLINPVGSTENEMTSIPFDYEDISNMRWAESGLSISKFDGYINVTYDRTFMASSLKDFMYISVVRSKEPLYQRSLYFWTYEAAVLNRGFLLYTDEGFNETIVAGDYFAITIYDDMKKPIGYYYNSEPYVP
jgi:serine/threonine protein kinase